MALASGLEDARATALHLLATRAQGATICPSEIARTLQPAGRAGHAGEDWRVLMPTVHAAVDQLLAEQRIRLSWKGKGLARREGPYRIGRV